MKTNAFPGFDNIKQLYDWNCYTKTRFSRLREYELLNKKKNIQKNLWRTV